MAEVMHVFVDGSDRLIKQSGKAPVVDVGPQTQAAGRQFTSGIRSPPGAMSTEVCLSSSKLPASDNAGLFWEGD